MGEPGSRIEVWLNGSSVTSTVAGNYEGWWEATVTLSTGPNLIRAIAYDPAGNASAWSYLLILTLDQTPPELAAEVSPVWQRIAEPINLTAVVTEAESLLRGDVWADILGPGTNGPKVLDPPGTGSTVWQDTFLGGLEGVYTATFKAQDSAGNVASQPTSFILDGTPPALAVTLSSAPPYSHVAGSAIYYGEGSGVFTLTAVATDTLSKLGQLIFPTTTSSGQTYTYEGLTSQTQVHTYAFTPASTFSGNLTLDATDRAGNLTAEPFSITYDNVAPTPPTITVPSAAPATFSLSWSGQDSGAGVRNYDVQVRDAITTTWTPWLTATTATEAQFTGSPGHSYYFQVRATDQVNNTGAWQQAGPVAIRSVTKYYTFGSSRVAMRQGDEVYYLHGDHLGSTSLTTDGSGVVVAQSRYLPYGQERWSDGAAPTDFGFTGQRNEAGFGLMDYKARYYDPLLGRFVSADTVVPSLVEPQSLNRYSYVRNNPIVRGDPSGHCDNWICDLVTAPIQLVQGLASGVRNIGNPEYQLGPQSQEIALDIIKRALTAPVTGDFPDSADYMVPASEVPQNHQALTNTMDWAANTADAAIDTSAMAGGVQVGVSILRPTSTKLLFQEGFSKAEMEMIENVASKYKSYGVDLSGIKLWRADGAPPGTVAAWFDDGIMITDDAFVSEEVMAQGLYEELLHSQQGITEFGGGNVAAAEKAVKPLVDEWWKWASGGN